jgi:hypothetical protein
MDMTEHVVDHRDAVGILQLLKLGEGLGKVVLRAPEIVSPRGDTRDDRARVGEAETMVVLAETRHNGGE